MTLNDIIITVGKNKMTEQEALEIIIEKDMSYAMKYANFYSEDINGYFGVFDSLKEKYFEIMTEKEKNKKPIIEKKVKMITCNCGHTVHETAVMSASLGTSCPDCYDRMSD